MLLRSSLFFFFFLFFFRSISCSSEGRILAGQGSEQEETYHSVGTWARARARARWKWCQKYVPKSGTIPYNYGLISDLRCICCTSFTLKRSVTNTFVSCTGPLELHFHVSFSQSTVCARSLIFYFLPLFVGKLLKNEPRCAMLSSDLEEGVELGNADHSLRDLLRDCQRDLREGSMRVSVHLGSGLTSAGPR